jgi:hypothetical protein
MYIGSAIHWFNQKPSLLGRHPFRRSDGCAGQGDSVVTTRPLDTGQAEVEDRDDGCSSLETHQDIGWLQVPVHQPSRVDPCDDASEIRRNAQAITQRHRAPIAGNRDGLAVDKLHHEVRPAVRCVARIKKCRHTSPSRSSECIPLPEKARKWFRAKMVRIEHLDGNSSGDGTTLPG